MQYDNNAIFHLLKSCEKLCNNNSIGGKSSNNFKNGAFVKCIEVGSCNFDKIPLHAFAQFEDLVSF